MLHRILESYGLPAGHCLIQKLESGLINQTWKITTDDNAYIMQQINTHVFTRPQDISANILQISLFLAEKVPDYLFVSPIATTTGEYLFQDSSGHPYRLMPFVKESHTVDTVSSRQEAFEASRQFGKFTSLLSQFNLENLIYTIPSFHDLSLRFSQFVQAYNKAPDARLKEARSAIREALNHQHLAKTYQFIHTNKLIPLRVIHHDTKISNVLFDKNNLGLCVIDLDTVMPGYFISDLGDMMRTYLSPVNEEEKDFSKIKIREDYFQAIIEGYFSEMAKELTISESNLCLYAGKYMIYMQAIRFLTDFLNGDKYYVTTYPKQNLIRAQNQFILLQRYIDAEDRLRPIVHQFLMQRTAAGI